MLYDSQTKLFYWECFELYDNYNTNSESEAQTFANVSTIYLSNDRLRRLHTTIPQPLLVSESVDHYDTLGQAQNALLHFFKKKPLPDYRLERPTDVNYLRNMPKRVFDAVHDRCQLSSAHRNPEAPRKTLEIKGPGAEWKYCGNLAGRVLQHRIGQFCN